MLRGVIAYANCDYWRQFMSVLRVGQIHVVKCWEMAMKLMEKHQIGATAVEVVSVHFFTNSLHWTAFANYNVEYLLHKMAQVPFSIHGPTHPWDTNKCKQVDMYTTWITLNK